MLDDVRERQEHAAEAWLLLRRGLVPREGACTVHMCVWLSGGGRAGEVHTCQTRLRAGMLRYEALSSENSLLVVYFFVEPTHPRPPPAPDSKPNH